MTSIGEPTFRSDQEMFWAGEFGTGYSARNTGASLVASNVRFFSRALSGAGPLATCLEFGANVGMNLRALRVLYPALELKAVEINETAAKVLDRDLGPANVFHGSMFDYVPESAADLVLIKGVLIHLSPDLLPLAYEKLVESTARFLLVCEYYNPTPVAVSYRGHDQRLFKRDFAGELLDRYPALSLAEYGFAYHRDPVFPQDDITWFLLRKTDG